MKSSLESNAGQGESSSDPPSESGARSVAIVLAAGIAAGLASWGIGESVRGAFDPTLTLELSLSNQMYGLVNAAVVRTSAVTYGISAGLTGLLVGIATGLALGDVRRGLLAGLAAAVLGAAGAAGAAVGAIPLFKANYNPDTNDLLFPMAMHGAIWSCAGLAAGFGFGLATGGRSNVIRAVVAGVAGALVGTVAYELAGALAFASDKTIEPIAEARVPRMLAHLLPVLCASAAVLLTSGASRAKPAAALEG